MRLFYSLALVLFFTVSVFAEQSLEFDENNGSFSKEKPLVLKKGNEILSSNTYYYEDFNSGTIPSDMTFYDIDKNKAYYTNWEDGPWVPYLFDVDDYVMISTSYYSPAGQADDWMITPMISIGKNTYLKWDAMAWNQNLRDGYEVLVSTTGNSVEDFETVVFSTSAENTTSTERFVNLEDKGFIDQDIYIAFRNNSDRKFVLSIDNIMVYSPDTYDVTIHNVETPEYLKINEEYTFEGVLQSFGTETITSFTLNYKDNDNETVSQKISDIEIPLHDYYEFEFDAPWSTDVTGEHKIVFWVTDINNNPDEDPNNDSFTGFINVYDPAMTYPRLNMYEVFTSATCPPCKGGNEQLDKILDNHEGEYTLLKYQMSWPGDGDIYYTAEGGVRRQYYGISSVPSTHIDGDDGFNPNNFTEEDFQLYTISPAFVELSATYNIDDQTVTAECHIDAKADINSNSIVLLGAIFEYTTYNNRASNGETEFHHVMKKMLPNAEGTDVKSVVEGERQTFDFTYTFPKSNTVEEFDDLGVVFFLQDELTGKVFNSTTAVLSASSIEEAPKNGITAVFPNPTNNITYLNYLIKTQGEQVSVYVHSIDGNILLSIDKGYQTFGNHTLPLNLANLSSGSYVIRLKIGNDVFTHKVSVAR